MMKKNFSKYFMIAAVAVTMGFVSSCKDYNDEIIAEYRGQDAKLSQLLDELTQKHNEDIVAAQVAREEMKNALEKAIQDLKEEEIKWAVDSIGKLDARIADLESRVDAIDAIGGRLDVLENINAGQRLSDIEEILGALETVIGDSTAVATWASDLKDLQNDVVTARGSLPP